MYLSKWQFYISEGDGSTRDKQCNRNSYNKVKGVKFPTQNQDVTYIYVHV